MVAENASPSSSFSFAVVERNAVTRFCIATFEYVIHPEIEKGRDSWRVLLVRHHQNRASRPKSTSIFHTRFHICLYLVIIMLLVNEAGSIPYLAISDFSKVLLIM